MENDFIPKAFTLYHINFEKSSDFLTFFQKIKKRTDFHSTLSATVPTLVGLQFSPTRQQGLSVNRSFQNFPYRGRFTKNGY